jgi:hypothetical protein
MPLAPHAYIVEARNLLTQADHEPDAARRIAGYEEAFELLETVRSGAVDEAAAADRTLAANLRRTHTRQLLTRLPELMNVTCRVWFDYIRLLMLDVPEEVEAALRDSPELNQQYQGFARLWGAETIEFLDRKLNERL